MAAWLRRHSKTSIALVLIFLGTAAVFLRWFYVTPADPVYRGHRLSWWLRHEGEENVPSLETEDLRSIGTPAVQWLTYQAEHGTFTRKRRIPTTKLGLWLDEKEYDLRFRFDLWEVHFNARHQALYCLVKLGPDAAPAIPALARILQSKRVEDSETTVETEDVFYESADDSTCSLAAAALIATGPAARSTILRIFAEGSSQVRGHIAFAMSRVEPPSATTIEYLKLALRSADFQDRLAASSVLRILSDDAGTESLIPIVIEILPTSEGLLRVQLIDWLTTLGERAAPAIPQLLEWADDTNPDVRNSISHALIAIDHTRKTTAPRMREWLQSPDPFRQELARQVLVGMGEIEYLMLACRDPDVANRRRAFGGVMACANDHENGVVMAQVVSMAIAFLSDPSVPSREEIVDWLTSLGERAAPAVPQLLELADDTNPDVRDSIGYALIAIDRTRKKTAPRMREWLQSPDPFRQALARQVLFGMGELKDE